MKRSLRFAVLQRDAFTCQYCGRSAPTVRLEVDHIHPRSAGGRDALQNLVTACHDCNQGKKHYLLSRGARMVLEDDYDEEGYADWEAAYVLAEQAFTNAITDAYERGRQDQILREEPRDEAEEMAVRAALANIAQQARRIQ